MKCAHLKNMYFAIHGGFILRKGLHSCVWWSCLSPWQGWAQCRRDRQAGLPTHPSGQNCCRTSCFCSLPLVVLPWEVRPPHWDRPRPCGIETSSTQCVWNAFQSGREAWRAPFSAWAFDLCQAAQVEIHPFVWGQRRRALDLGRDTTTRHCLISLVEPAVLSFTWCCGS